MADEKKLGPFQQIEEIARKACGDPGSIVARKPDETLPAWQAHAVATALDCRGLLRHPDEATEGWKREADVLRRAAESLDRHVDSYEAVASVALRTMRERGRTEEQIRQRQRLERRYVRGLLAAIDDLYEMAEEAEKKAGCADLAEREGITVRRFES